MPFDVLGRVKSVVFNSFITLVVFRMGNLSESYRKDIIHVTVDITVIITKSMVKLLFQEKIFSKK